MRFLYPCAKLRFAAVLAGVALVAAAPARADDLITLPEPATNASTIASTQFNAVAFTFSAGFNNVDIAASLTAAAAGNSGTAYLTTAVGAGTTSADVVASGSFNFAVASGTTVSYVTLFTGLSLPADDYFLVMGSPLTGSGAIELTNQQSFTTHPDVTVGDMLFSQTEDPNFAPASTWSTSGLGNRYIRVTGEPIPEPASAIALTGLAALALLRRRK